MYRSKKKTTKQKENINTITQLMMIIRTKSSFIDKHTYKREKKYGNK
jgi:hypothetical protein